MAELAIFIDSTGDLDKALRDQYNIDYLTMGLTFLNKEIPASLDWDKGYTPHEFYDVMRSGEKIFTSQVTRQEIENKFKAALEKGEDVLYIACASGLSQSVTLAKTIAKEMAPSYPNNQISVVDSLICGYAQGDMAIRARKMKNEGKSLEEITNWLETNKLRYNQWAAVDNLNYLKRAGRVKASTAFFGNLFGVKPIVISDVTGVNYAIKKVKGRKASLIQIVEDTIATAEDIEHQTIYIAHSDDPEGAEFCKQELLKRAKPLDVHIGILGPIIGGSTGPGTISLYCFGKEVTAKAE